MWIFTSNGMVSCVRHREKTSTILIRGRAKQHVLEFIGESNKQAYFHLGFCDYNHRAELNEIEFRKRLLKAAENITYPDFKGSIPNEPESHSYKRACSEVWHCMNDFKLGKYDTPSPIWQLEGDDVDEELDRVFGKPEPAQ